MYFLMVLFLRTMLLGLTNMFQVPTASVCVVSSFEHFNLFLVLNILKYLNEPNFIIKHFQKISYQLPYVQN